MYDAKIRDVAEGKDKKGKKCFEYLVHFQGWNSGWDRKVSEDFLLKDSAENRKLQRDLAEKSQLQLGAYLYRKERKKRKRILERNLLLNTTGNTDEANKQEQQEVEYSSSATESHDDDRVFLHMGDVLKAHLEFDYKQVTQKVAPKLPAALPIVTILENFVKSHAIKVFTGPLVELPKPKKRRSSILPGKKEPKVKQIDYDALANGVDLCKEVADGLRVYFNFILRDFLLYPEEKEEMEKIMTEEKLKDFKFNPGEQLVLSSFFSKQEPPTPELSSIPENTEGSTSSNADKKPPRLRSHSCKTEEEEKPENMSSIASTSSGDSAMPEVKKKGIFSKNWFPLNAGISPKAKKIIEETFSWRMIPLNAEPEPSMIFGIYHLTRLVVKLPEFLSATPMNEEKLTMLLKYLDSFVEFLEENPEIYGPQNYHITEDENVKEEIKLEPSDEDTQDSKKSESKVKKESAVKSSEK